MIHSKIMQVQQKRQKKFIHHDMKIPYNESSGSTILIVIKEDDKLMKLNHTSEIIITEKRSKQSKKRYEEHTSKHPQPP